jgi:hypothetical protein
MQDLQHLYFNLGSSLADTKCALLTSGCFVLRDAIDSRVLPHLYETTRRLFEEDQTDYGRGSIVRERGVCNGRFLARVALDDEEGITKLLSHPRLAAHLENILEEPPALHPLYNVRYRNPTEPATALPYHQHPHHAPPGELSLSRTRFIGISIPFVPYDGSRSDLELITIAMDQLLPIADKPETQFASFELDRGMVLHKFGERRWRPTLGIGDVIVFRECTLHRSYVEETMPNPRASVDVRIFGSKDPITVFKGADGILLPGLERIKAPSV